MDQHQRSRFICVLACSMMGDTARMSAADLLLFMPIMLYSPEKVTARAPPPFSHLSVTVPAQLNADLKSS